MSAYDEYAAERANVDKLVSMGYVIVAMKEGLHGSDLAFAKPDAGPDGAEPIGLRLLNADARKYAAGLVFAGLRSSEEQGA